MDLNGEGVETLKFSIADPRIFVLDPYYCSHIFSTLLQYATYIQFITPAF